jgi:predicted nucleic acid-binding protein
VVLVDTSVWVWHLRQSNKELEALLLEAEVAGHDFVIGELACGRLKKRSEILSLLQALPRMPVATQDELLFFIEEHSLDGAGIGLVDIHLLASAKLAGVTLWTLDQKLKSVAAKLNILHMG